MTCAQGLLRLLWGGPEVGVLRDCQCFLIETLAEILYSVTDISMRRLIVLPHSGDCQMGLKIPLVGCILRFVVANLGMIGHNMLPN